MVFTVTTTTTTTNTDDDNDSNDIYIDPDNGNDTDDDLTWHTTVQDDHNDNESSDNDASGVQEHTDHDSREQPLLAPPSTSTPPCDDDNNNNDERPQIVVSSAAKYGWLFVVLLWACFLPQLLLLLPSLIFSPRAYPLEASLAFVYLAAITTLLPIRFDVLSDGSVRVVAFWWSWTYPDTVRAYRCTAIRPGTRAVSFVTHRDYRLCVKRPRGKVDLYISPQDPDGFLDALCRVVAELEQRDWRDVQRLQVM